MMIECFMVPIWVINLRRSVERRAFIRNQLDGLGLAYELVEAVDGRELSPEEMSRLYSPSQAIALIGRELTPGEIGCSLSHLRLYQRQVDEGHEEVLILEDDVIIDAALLEILRRRDAMPADREIVLCHRLNSLQVSYWRSRPIDERYRCVRFAVVADGARGYLLRRSGALKLLAGGYPVRMPADSLTGGQTRTGVRLYGLDPPCMREHDSSVTPTTMPESHAVRRRWPTKEELGRAGWALHKAKWRVVHSFRRFNPFSII